MDLIVSKVLEQVEHNELYAIDEDDNDNTILVSEFILKLRKYGYLKINQELTDKVLISLENRKQANINKDYVFDLKKTGDGEINWENVKNCDVIFEFVYYTTELPSDSLMCYLKFENNNDNDNDNGDHNNNDFCLRNQTVVTRLFGGTNMDDIYAENHDVTSDDLLDLFHPDLLKKIEELGIKLYCISSSTDESRTFVKQQLIKGLGKRIAVDISNSILY